MDVLHLDTEETAMPNKVAAPLATVEGHRGPTEQLGPYPTIQEYGVGHLAVLHRTPSLIL